MRLSAPGKSLRAYWLSDQLITRQFPIRVGLIRILTILDRLTRSLTSSDAIHLPQLVFDALPWSLRLISCLRKILSNATKEDSLCTLFIRILNGLKFTLLWDFTQFLIEFTANISMSSKDILSFFIAYFWIGSPVYTSALPPSTFSGRQRRTSRASSS